MSVDYGPPVLAACFNKPYVPHVATMLKSFSASAAAGARWYLVGDETVDEVTLNELLQFGAAQGLDATPLRIPDALVTGFEDRPVYPRIAWYRAVLADALPHEERLVYIDSDTVVLHDVTALWRTPLDESHLFGAVCHPSYAVGIDEYDRLGLPRGSPVLNSGVLVMDLVRMRDERFADQVRELAMSPDRPAFRYADQDAMNVQFAGRWTPVDPSWNAMSMVVLPFVGGATWSDDRHHDALVLERAARSPGIVHFDGASVLRPWHRRCFNPFAGLYRKYRASTPWPLARLQGKRHDELFAHIPPRLQARIWHRRYLRGQRAGG